MKIRQFAAVLLLSLCATAVPAAEPAPAGQVMSVTGVVMVSGANGQLRPLERGAEVRQGDLISTSAGALVQVKMIDGGYLSVRSGTEVRVDKYHADSREPEKSGILLSLIKGGFRSITGLIGRARPDSYQVRTPTATIGIRGTDHEPMFIPEAPKGVPVIELPGLYDKVNDGETFIRNARGLAALKVGQVGFSPINPTLAPAILQKMPEFYKIDTRIDAREAAVPEKGEARQAANPKEGLMLAPSLKSRLDSSGGGKASLGTATIGTATLNVAPTTLIQTAPLVSDTKLSTSTLSSPTLIQTAPVVTDSKLSTTTLIAPTLSTSTLSTTTLTAPKLTTTTIAPTTTLTSPTLNTTTLTSPTLISPTLNTTTLIKP